MSDAADSNQCRQLRGKLQRNETLSIRYFELAFAYVMVMLDGCQ